MLTKIKLCNWTLSFNYVLSISVIQTTSIIESYAGVKKPAAEITDFPHRSIMLGAQPSHLDVSCDCQHLAVGFNASGSSAIRVYDITSFTAQVCNSFCTYSAFFSISVLLIGTIIGIS